MIDMNKVVQSAMRAACLEVATQVFGSFDFKGAFKRQARRQAWEMMRI